jgi:hypothetical protein
MKRTTPKQPALTITEEIIQLHDKITAALKTSLQNAIRIGELITEVRSETKHGEWLPWIKEHMPFSDETARKYMKLHQHQDKFQSDWNLTDAYEYILPPKKPKCEAIDIDFEEVDSEADDHGIVALDLSDSEMKLGHLIELDWQDSEPNTRGHKIIGFCPGQPDNGYDLIEVFPFYGDLDEVDVKYIFHRTNYDEMVTRTDSSKDALPLITFLMYITKHPKVNSSNIHWHLTDTYVSIIERIKI